MIKIAIVDGEASICELIQEKILKNFINEEVEFKTYLFNTGSQLLKSLEEKVYDIILLDIDIPNINGLEITRIIRDMRLNSIIIYVTSKISYMPDAFGLNVFAFIDKKELETTLINTIKDCITYLCSNNLLTFKTREGFIKLQKDEIIIGIYLNRKVSLFTRDYEYSINHTSLKEFYEMVNSADFIYVNKGTIINLKYLKSTQGGEAKLQYMDELLLISKERIREVNISMMNYVSKNGMLR